MKIIIAMLSILLSLGVHAQDVLAGKYQGTVLISTVRPDEPFSMELVIDNVQDGTVTGTATTIGNICAGKFPMQGKLDGNKLALKSTGKGNSLKGCSLDLDLIVNGKKLTGTTGNGDPVKLSK
jgi:hypothetical protein